MDNMELKDKVVLISGAGSGLGRALALRLAREGARIVLTGRRKDKLEQTRAAIVEEGGTANVWPADVSVSMDVEDLVSAVADEWGGIDILINNAGVFPPLAPVYETSIQDWDTAVATNLRGPFLLIRTVLPLMLAAKHGQILNISAPLKHFPGAAAYCASKCALDSLTKATAFELRSKNIRVNAVEPPLLDTEMHEGGKPPEEILGPILELLKEGDLAPTGRIVKLE